MKHSLRDQLDSAQIVSTLVEIGHLLELEEASDLRVRRVLELLGRLVPNDSCALLAGVSEDAHLYTVPEAPEMRRAALRASLSRILRVMEGNADIEPSRAGSGHLALPIIGADRIVGVLEVERDDTYDLPHVQLLSAVASQLGAYLATVELKHRERRAQEALREAKSSLETRVKERTAELETRNAEILAQSKQLQELSVRLMRTQDEERRRISREMHDSVSQYLASAMMNLEALKRPDATEKQAQSYLGLADSLDKCLTETRTISHLLHPPLLDELGLSAAVRLYVEGFSKRSGIQANLSIPVELGRLPDVLGLAFFRILQESLTNIHRHSHSRSVDIRLEPGADQITLEVRDYGQGMPSELLGGLKPKASPGAGVGLTSMRERINELGGRFEIQSDKNGTLIRVTAPWSGTAKESGLAAGNRSGA